MRVIKKVSDRVEIVTDGDELGVRYTRNGWQWHMVKPDSHLHCLEIVDAILWVSKMLYSNEATDENDK